MLFVKACSKLWALFHVIASAGNRVIFEKVSRAEVRLWQYCVRFDRPKIDCFAESAMITNMTQIPKSEGAVPYCCKLPKF